MYTLTVEESQEILNEDHSGIVNEEAPDEELIRIHTEHNEAP